MNVTKEIQKATEWLKLQVRVAPFLGLAVNSSATCTERFHTITKLLAAYLKDSQPHTPPKCPRCDHPTERHFDHNKTEQPIACWDGAMHGFEHDGCGCTYYVEQADSPRTSKATALAAAEEINNVNRARGHVLKSDHYGETADVMPTEEMARIIQQHVPRPPAMTNLERRTLEILSTLMAHVGRDSKSDMVCSDCLHPIETLIEDLQVEALKE